MANIITRAGKGAPLSWNEADANFTGLNDGKLEKYNNLSDLDSIPTALVNLHLNNVNNTSDADKPVSTAQQTAIDSAVSTHVSLADPHIQYLKETDAASSTGSSLIGFIQTGSGAVATTTQEVLRETVSVKHFGAVGNGIVNDTAAFTAAIATGKKVYVPNGTYNITTLTITNRTEIEGESQSGTIIQGDGDLIYLSTINSSLHLSDITIQNITTRGALVKVTYGSDIIESTFNRVHFKKSNHHINTYRGVGPSFVNWVFRDCRFIDAAIVSRLYGAAWTLLEDNCYTWYCNKGIQFSGNVATVRIVHSVFELNGREAIYLNVATNATVNGLLFDSIHFEANGQTVATSDVVIDGDPTTAVVDKLTFLNCGSFAPTVTPTVSIPTPSQIVTFNNLSLIGCRNFTVSAPAAGNVWSSIEYRNDFQVRPLASVLRLLGSVGGNGTVQVASVHIAIGEAHRVQAYTGNSGAGTVNVYQEYIVSRSVVGVISVATVADIAAGGYGVVITTGAGVYGIQNKAAMPNTYQPYIIIEKL